MLQKGIVKVSLFMGEESDPKQVVVIIANHASNEILSEQYPRLFSIDENGAAVTLPGVSVAHMDEPEDGFYDFLVKLPPRERRYIGITEALRIIGHDNIETQNNRKEKPMKKQISLPIPSNNPFASLSAMRTRTANNMGNNRGRTYSIRENGISHFLIPSESRDYYMTAKGVNKEYGAASCRLALAAYRPFAAPFGVDQNGKPFDVGFDSLAGAFYMLHVSTRFPYHGKLSRLSDGPLIKLQRNVPDEYRIAALDVPDRHYWVAKILWYSFAGLIASSVGWQRRNPGIDSPSKLVEYLMQWVKTGKENEVLPIAGYRYSLEQIENGEPARFDSVGNAFSYAYNDFVAHFKDACYEDYAGMLAVPFDETELRTLAMSRDHKKKAPRDKHLCADESDDNQSGADSGGVDLDVGSPKEDGIQIYREGYDPENDGDVASDRGQCPLEVSQAVAPASLESQIEDTPPGEEK